MMAYEIKKQGKMFTTVRNGERNLRKPDEKYTTKNTNSGNWTI